LATDISLVTTDVSLLTW